MRASYLRLIADGEFDARVAGLYELMSPCRLCPRECGADRAAGGTGYCRSGDVALVASSGSHFGEEHPLVGTGGSGTIFLSNCNLGCIFCQNHDISQEGHGGPASAEILARMALQLQESGCHNINFVTPTHFAPQIAEAIGIAAKRGLKLPIVWNCGGYESLEALRLLDGIVDIYMPDLKYADAAVAERLSGAPQYPTRAVAAIREMHRQVGDLAVDRNGVAERGLLVRHLVLPEGLAGTAELMEFLAELSTDTYVNVMAQYRPLHRADEEPALARKITRDEFEQAVLAALDAGLHRLDQRPMGIL